VLQWAGCGTCDEVVWQGFERFVGDGRGKRVFAVDCALFGTAGCYGKDSVCVFLVHVGSTLDFVWGNDWCSLQTRRSKPAFLLMHSRPSWISEEPVSAKPYQACFRLAPSVLACRRTIIRSVRNGKRVNTCSSSSCHDDTVRPLQTTAQGVCGECSKNILKDFQHDEACVR
jgi:hypothetical protein